MSNAFQFQALIYSLYSRWWQGTDPRYSMVCTRCWHSCKSNFGKQGKRQDTRRCSRHSGVGLVPWEHGSISCVRQAWILLCYSVFFKANQVSSCYGFQVTLNNQMSVTDTEICRNDWIGIESETIFLYFYTPCTWARIHFDEQWWYCNYKYY